MGKGARVWHSDPWRLLVISGAGLVLPSALLLQLVFERSLLSIIATGLAVVMLLIGGIGWLGSVVGQKRRGWSPAAMVAFISTEVFIVIGLLMSYWIIRLQADLWPPTGSPDIPVPYLALFLLALASVIGGQGQRLNARENIWGFANVILVTVVIWIAFATMVVFRWVELSSTGFTFGSNAYGAIYYSMTGIHFAHVLFGVAILLLALPAAFKGQLSVSYTRSMTLYLHYINALGLLLLSQLSV